VETTRSVDPLQFAHTGGHWYLLGYCHLRNAGRWFRLDRIKAARLTSEPARAHDVSTVIGRPPPEARPLA
jgi:predicted DNA-binding transcriptional regulator YafY